MRHTERADVIWNAEESWHQSQDFRRFTNDPPLSEHGLGEAEAIGQVVHDWVKERNDQVTNIICSPYLRCVQTAAKICKELGPATRIIIDYNLAEVQSLDIVGDGSEAQVTRPMEDIQAYCKLHAVRCRETTMGAMPAAPETVRAARKRYMRRFLEYLHWSLKSQQNFIFVSHGECVHATMTLMPSQGECGHAILGVEFGGFFLASRETQKDSKDDDDYDLDDDDEEWLNQDLIPERQVPERQVSTMSTHSMFSESTAGGFSRQVSCESTLSVLSNVPDSAGCEFEEEDDDSSSTNASEASIRRWKVWFHNIKSMKSTKEQLDKRLNRLTQSGPYNREELIHLLGESSTKGNLQPFLEQLSDEQLVKLGKSPLGSEDPNFKKSDCAGSSMVPCSTHAVPQAILKSGYNDGALFKGCNVLPSTYSRGLPKESGLGMKQDPAPCKEDPSLPSIPPSDEPVDQDPQMNQDTAAIVGIRKRQVVLHTIPSCKLLQRRRCNTDASSTLSSPSWSSSESTTPSATSTLV